MSRASRKYYRTIVLGVLAMAALVWSAVNQFGVPWAEIVDLFLATLLALALIVLCAALAAGAWVGLRKLLHRGDD